MPFTGPSPAEIERIVADLIPIIFEHGENPFAKIKDMTFAEIERTSSSVGQVIVQQLIGRALANHTASQSLPETVDCPACVIRSRLTRKTRRIKTASGVVSYDEPASHCGHCRRDFFPSAEPVAIAGG